MKKRDKIAEYNKLHDNYYITDIKKMTEAEIEGRIKYGARSLDDCYKSYSNQKRSSYQAILNTYEPRILAVTGSSFSYSVLLMASNNDMLLITKSNNYLIERVQS